MRRKHNTLSGPLAKQNRQQEALDRQEGWDALDPAGKVAVLDQRLGEGVGATKQRARLAAQMTKKQKSNAKKEK